VDLAWLRMDAKTNPMMITVVLRFKGQVNYDRLITDLQSTVQRFRRLRQRVVIPGKIFHRPYWDDVPAFKVQDHVERLNLRFPADDLAVGELVNQKMNTALDFSYPLWKLTLVDDHPEGSIIIVRIHHCIADGISLMRVLLQMTHPSTQANVDQNSVNEPDWDENKINHPTASALTMAEAIESKSKGTAGRDTLYRKPGFTDIVAAIVRIVFRPADPPTILKAPLGEVKKAVWSEPFSVPEIKKIAEIKQATINDVMMAITSGAIRRYMDLHNEARESDIRAFIMVNMRGLAFDDDLGNKFGLVFLTLPLNRVQPMERLERVKNGMDFLKASAEYAASYIILNILGQLPEWVEHLATRILDTKGTVVATNVPGSRNELFIADAPIQSMVGWVPQSGRVGVGLSYVSYNNQLIVGLNADAGVIPDPEKLLEFFTEEYQSFKTVLSLQASQ
jgi:diacylglycerol O-acyltransferase / wax synthase